MEKEKNQPAENEGESEYIGNIWGWKFSFISLAIILFFIALMAYRHWTLKAPFPTNAEKKQDSTDNFKNDTISIPKK